MMNLRENSSSPTSVRSNLIGFGGFSQLGKLGFTPEFQVLLARNTATSQLTSIRQLKSFPEPTTLRRLLAETNRLTGFEHPNVCTVVGAWVDDAAVWCATEYHAGESLAQLAIAARARKAAIPLEVVVRVLLEVSRGCAAVRTFDPKRHSMPLSMEEVWVGSDGKTRFIPLTCVPTPQRATLRDLVPAGAFESSHDVFFLSCLWWEALTGSALSATTLAAPHSSLIPEPLQQLLVCALTRPAEFSSVAEFLVLALSTAESTLRVAESTEVAEWVNATQERTPAPSPIDLKQSAVRARVDLEREERQSRNAKPPTEAHAPGIEETPTDVSAQRLAQTPKVSTAPLAMPGGSTAPRSNEPIRAVTGSALQPALLAAAVTTTVTQSIEPPAPVTRATEPKILVPRPMVTAPALAKPGPVAPKVETASAAQQASRAPAATTSAKPMAATARVLEPAALEVTATANAPVRDVVPASSGRPKAKATAAVNASAASQAKPAKPAAAVPANPKGTGPQSSRSKTHKAGAAIVPAAPKSTAAPTSRKGGKSASGGKAAPLVVPAARPADASKAAGSRTQSMTPVAAPLPKVPGGAGSARAVGKSTAPVGRATKRPRAPSLHADPGSGLHSDAPQLAASDNTSLESALVRWADSLPQPVPRPGES